MEQTEDWSRLMAAQVGRRVAFFRERLKLTTQAVANRTGELGHPLERSVIAKLERGHRHSISMPEVIVLAGALEVPAIQLITPVGWEREVQILPGQKVSAEAAMLWFTGQLDLFRNDESSLVGHGAYSAESDLHEWYETSYVDEGAPIHLYAEHRGLVADYQDVPFEVQRRLGHDAKPAARRSELAALRKRIEERIKANRTAMLRRGIAVLPDLPPELEHLR